MPWRHSLYRHSGEDPCLVEPADAVWAGDAMRTEEAVQLLVSQARLRIERCLDVHAQRVRIQATTLSIGCTHVL